MIARSIRHRVTPTALALGGMLSTFFVGHWVAGQAPPGPPAPVAYKAEEPADRGLDANLYMQTAAEYRACCYQAFNLASLRLTAAMAKPPAGKPPAVVLDLDETVFDNAGFQAMQLRSNLAYDQRLWDAWERDHPDRVGLVPGAKEFIEEAKRSGVAVAYVSNRSAKFRDQTKAALARLGVPATDDELLKLNADPNTGNKSARRREVELAYTVLLYVGDNLRDFDEAYRYPDLKGMSPEQIDKAVLRRKLAVDWHWTEWGQRCVILPNPAYGEWAKPLGRGRADLDRLAPAGR